MAEYRVPSQKLDFDTAVEIWIRWFTTHEFQNRIAAEFDVNPGRVNEILKGKRHPGARQEALSRLNVSNDNGVTRSDNDQLRLI